VTRSRETLVFALSLAGLYAFMLWLSDGFILLTRPLWVDEVWTVLISGQASPIDVLRGLASGADGGAGLVHLSTWALQKIVGPPSPTLLRTLSLLCVFGTLCLTYAVLRRRFGADASIAGALAAGSHWLVVTHTFEARFYGPWLLCCALVALSLSLRQATPSRRHKVFLGASAVLLCTVHFYGAVTLSLMVAAVVASHGRRWRDGIRVVAPSAAGLLAVLAITPLAIGLRNAFTVPSWAPDFEIRQLHAFVLQFWVATVPLAAAIGLAIGLALGWKSLVPRSLTSIASDVARDAGIVALAGLFVMPLALTALTLVGQPAMIYRYAITTVLAWGPLVALAIELLGRWPARIAGLALLVFWFSAFVTVRFEKIVFAGDVEETEASVRLAQSLGVPIVLQSVHAWYPVWYRDPSRVESLGFLEMSDSTVNRLFRPGTRNERYNRGILIDRDMVRVHAKRYGVPRLVPQTSLDSMPRFVLIAAAAHLPVGFRSLERFSRSAFPHHTMRQLDFNTALLERRTVP
jgi:hypothetical protein